MNRFKLTKAHIELLRNSCVDYYDWVEFGAPAIDPKRPYGNSDVYADIARILKIKGKKTLDGDIDFTENQYILMDKLHQETAIALQIILSTGKFKIGTYVKKDEYDTRSWYKVKS